MKKFLLADDHFIVRTGISLLIRQEYHHAAIDECADGYTVMEKMAKQAYDLAILDLAMPGPVSTSLLKDILAIRPQQKILILSISPAEIYAQKYLHLGVKGFIDKTAGPVELSGAIRTVMNNKRYFKPGMKDIPVTENPGVKQQSPFEQLSDRELDVLPYLLEGMAVSTIARVMCLHTSTIGTHKARIFEKLGVSNLVELNRLAKLFPTTR